jgi:hypothetical protein
VLSGVAVVALGVPLALWIGSLTGVVFAAVAAVVGVLFFALGSALLALLHVPLWVDEDNGR